MLLTAWDPTFFCDEETYEEELEGLIAHMFTSRIDPAVGEIQLPGDPEFRHAAERPQPGLPLHHTTTLLEIPGILPQQPQRLIRKVLQWPVGDTVAMV